MTKSLYQKVKPLFLVLLLLPSYTFAAKTLSKHFRTLSRIQSPYSLIASHFPKQYTVPLTLSGSIADEIKSVLDTLDIEMVHYTEQFDRKKGFQLVMTNNTYTAQTRDLLAGILNPLEMTDIILRAILKFQEKETLLKMQQETSLKHTKKTVGGIQLSHYILTPRGNRFSYQYRDMGAHIHESWLTELQVALDPGTMRAHELSLTKHSRTFSADQQERPVPKMSRHTYVFTYNTIAGIGVPTKLTMYVDSVQVCVLTASYNKQASYILFNKREITYLLSDTTHAHLAIQYNSYRYNRPLETEKTISPGKYSKKLKRATALSRKAVEALNKGNIQAAVSILQTLIDKYPGTPQAVEAQKLLTGLPHGL